MATTPTKAPSKRRSPARSKGSRRKAAADGETDLVFQDNRRVEDLDEALEVIPYEFVITSYGADYDVDGLVRRLNRGDILVPTFDPEIEEQESGIVGFQRRFVWRKPQSDRFIESLLLGLPVPGVFLVKEPSGVLLVLDGQQRLRTLQSFVNGKWGDRVYKLETVQDRFRGSTYTDLSDEDRRRLDDGIVHATIVQQDQPSEDQESIYLIFERLNTGGTQLTPQEIRSALYNGRLARLLRDLNENKAWRAIYGRRSERFKDQELILRFFAMAHYGDQYARPMKVFLNRYMATNRELKAQSGSSLTSLFEVTISAVQDAVGNRAFRLKNAINAAVFDAVMVGLAKRVQAGHELKNSKLIRQRYNALLKQKTFLESVERATADEESVRRRIAAATRAFKQVK